MRSSIKLLLVAAFAVWLLYGATLVMAQRDRDERRQQRATGEFDRLRSTVERMDSEGWKQAIDIEVRLTKMESDLAIIKWLSQGVGGVVIGQLVVAGARYLSNRNKPSPVTEK